MDTIPGIARRTAEIIVAEIGTDMTRFPSAQHLAAWAGLAPGNYELSRWSFTENYLSGQNGECN